MNEKTFLCIIRRWHSFIWNNRTHWGSGNRKVTRICFSYEKLDQAHRLHLAWSNLRCKVYEIGFGCCLAERKMCLRHRSPSLFPTKQSWNQSDSFIRNTHPFTVFYITYNYWGDIHVWAWSFISIVFEIYVICCTAYWPLLWARPEHEKSNGLAVVILKGLNSLFFSLIMWFVFPAVHVIFWPSTRPPLLCTTLYLLMVTRTTCICSFKCRTRLGWRWFLLSRPQWFVLTFPRFCCPNWRFCTVPIILYLRKMSVMHL